MGMIKEIFGGYKTATRYNMYGLIDNLGLKRPFALKVSGMQGKIPEAALPEEKEYMKSLYTQAFAEQKRQEMNEEFAKAVEGKLKEYKKIMKRKNESINYEQFKSPIDCEQFKSYKAIPQEMLEKGVFTYELDSFKKCNEKIGNTDFTNSEYVITTAKELISELKKRAARWREEKQETKHAFKYYLKQIEYGVKLAKKYGELNYTVKDHKPMTECYVHAENCEYSADWKKHEEDEKISGIRRSIIRHMERPD